MKKIIFMLSLFFLTAGLGVSVYAMTGLNVSITAPSSAKPGEEVSVVVEAEIPGGQSVKGIQVDFAYSEGFPDIDNSKCHVTNKPSEWSISGITKSNLLAVGDEAESDSVMSGELVFTIPEENPLSQYTIYIESAIAVVNGEGVDFNIENKSVSINVINVEGGSTESGGSSNTEENTTEKTTEETTDRTASESTSETENSSSSSSSGTSGRTGSSSSSSKKKTAETADTAEISEKEASSSEIIMKIGSTKMTVFGEEITNDVPPIIENSRTMLPIRFISECMGAKVDWNPYTKEITITDGETSVKLTIGSNQIIINGKQSEIDTAPFIQNSRTYVPVRFISEALGLKVSWNETEKTVTITKTEQSS